MNTRCLTVALRPVLLIVPLVGCFGPDVNVAATAVPIADVRGPMSLPLSPEERAACPDVGSIDAYPAGESPGVPHERVAMLQAVGELGVPPSQVAAWLRHRAGDVCADAIVETTIDPHQWTEDSMSFVGRGVAIRFIEA